jgi:hypothetical protein
MDYGVITWFEGRNKRVGDIRYHEFISLLTFLRFTKQLITNNNKKKITRKLEWKIVSCKDCGRT